MCGTHVQYTCYLWVSEIFNKALLLFDYLSDILCKYREVLILAPPWKPFTHFSASFITYHTSSEQ